MNLKTRLKSYGLWVSIFATIPMFAQVFGWNGLPANYADLVNSLLGVFVVLGILSNPTTETKGFSDDK